MRQLMTCCLALAILTNSAGGQEVPEDTKEGQKAVNELIVACIKGGDLAPADRPDGKGKYLWVADRVKLKATKAEAEQKAFVDALQRTHPQHAGFRDPKPCTIQQARDCLGENEVALLFTVGEDTTRVLLLEKKARKGDKGEGMALFSLPGAKELEPLLDTLLAPQTLQRPALVRPLAEKLWQKLLGSLADRIAGKDLLIVADGILTLLPFEILVECKPGQQRGPWLVQTRRIRYVSSLSAAHAARLGMKDRRIRKEPDRKYWAVADPLYHVADARLKGRLPRKLGRMGTLPESVKDGKEVFSRLERGGKAAQTICKLLGTPADAVLLGEKATEANVKAASARGDLARARYIFFATHGVIQGEHSSLPALVLGLIENDGKEDAGGPNDGFLQLPEVTQLQLNADLVVLNACETARGERVQGEGVRSLARAFLYAGSKGVVASLWKVDEAKSAELMVALFSELKRGSSSADALRQAQLKLIEQGLAPFFWASFVLMGE